MQGRTRHQSLFSAPHPRDRGKLPAECHPHLPLLFPILRAPPLGTSRPETPCRLMPWAVPPPHPGPHSRTPEPALVPHQSQDEAKPQPCPELGGRAWLLLRTVSLSSACGLCLRLPLSPALGPLPCWTHPPIFPPTQGLGLFQPWASTGRTGQSQPGSSREALGVGVSQKRPRSALS